jgi:putative redox protein
MSLKRTKVVFKSSGVELAGLLESPEFPAVRAYALFAHCFTCGKDIRAASRISRELVSLGYAVLRFDFTGLGGSDGDFANTNFSSNVGDLIAAANYLRDQYQAPQLLLGHSLGGAAVLKAANEIPEIAAVATIGAPFHAEHVSMQLSSELDTILHEGIAEVDLAGRKFKIKKQFIDDLRDQTSDHLTNLGCALLIMHSPVDSVVGIKEAEKTYKAARHPKSFISLDNADHLLSRAEDASYVAKCVSAWAGRFLPEPDSEKAESPTIAKGHVLVAEKDQKFTQTVITDNHSWIADEPSAVGGSDLGPDPYEHLLAALGTCTAMTLRMYARRKELPLENISIELQHSREHIMDCENCENESERMDILERKITLNGNLSDAQRERLLEIADKCPVHRTLENSPLIRTTIA